MNPQEHIPNETVLNDAHLQLSNRTKSTTHHEAMVGSHVSIILYVSKGKNKKIS